MKAICVDDDEMILELTVSFMEESELFDEVSGFSRAEDAIDYLKNNRVSMALLDVDMPVIGGMELASRIKEIDSNISIIFLTGYAEYALDAFKVHADGYLLKPIEKEKLFEELKYVLSNKKESSEYLVTARTFGNFDLFIGDKVVVFKRAKAKEILAYLIDQRGGTVTRAELFAALWEDGVYDRPMQKQMDVIVRSMRDTLSEYEISDILDIQSGSMRIKPELIDCDMYKYLDGDEKARQSFMGVYMNSYYWAETTEAALTGELE